MLMLAHFQHSQNWSIALVTLFTHPLASSAVTPLAPSNLYFSSKTWGIWWQFLNKSLLQLYEYLNAQLLHFSATTGFHEKPGFIWGRIVYVQSSCPHLSITRSMCRNNLYSGNSLVKILDFSISLTYNVSFINSRHILSAFVTDAYATLECNLLNL